MLRKYIEEIELFNPAYGLVRVKDRDELITRHILDSLAPFRLLRSLVESQAPAPPVVADVGSGAGLPGIPLAIAFQAAHGKAARVTLIERMGKRAGFLRDCTAVLGLTNVTVEETGFERAAPGRFGLVVFRALHPLTPDLLKNLTRLLAPGGSIAAYKGRRQTAEAELAAVRAVLPGLNAELAPAAVPFLAEERHIIVVHARP